MDNKLFNEKIKWIAHRGLSSQALENTLEAFELAGKMPFYGIECDIHLTRDNYIVVHHDDSTLRLTNIDFLISEKTLIELRELPIHLPKLSEYIKICRKYSKKAIIEIKPALSEDKIKYIIDNIKENNYLDNTILISFNVENIIAARKYVNNLQIQLLADRVNDYVISMAQKYQFDVNLNYRNITKNDIDRLKAMGLKVNVWTVNDFNSARKLIDLGVDYITTNGI